MYLTGLSIFVLFLCPMQSGCEYFAGSFCRSYWKHDGVPIARSTGGSVGCVSDSATGELKRNVFSLLIV
jgi:hypothetical protein